MAGFHFRISWKERHRSRTSGRCGGTCRRETKASTQSNAQSLLFDGMSLDWIQISEYILRHTHTHAERWSRTHRCTLLSGHICNLARRRSSTANTNRTETILCVHTEQNKNWNGKPYRVGMTCAAWQKNKNANGNVSGVWMCSTQRKKCHMHFSPSASDISSERHAKKNPLEPNVNKTQKKLTIYLF